MLNCIIIDDESLARELLEDNVRQVPFLSCTGSFANALDAMEHLKRESVDLIFLDIQMPGINGMQWLEIASPQAAVIMVTAYEKYALDAFALNVTDYLLKPVSFARFLKAVQKVYDSQNVKTQEPEFMFVHADYGMTKVLFADILYFEGIKDYLKIHLRSSSKPLLTKITFKSIEENLATRSFMRVHKSYLVNIDAVEWLRRNRIGIGSHEIPIGESYKEAVYAVIERFLPHK